jgi:hypothetical protein
MVKVEKDLTFLKDVDVVVLLPQLVVGHFAVIVAQGGLHMSSLSSGNRARESGGSVKPTPEH